MMLDVEKIRGDFPILDRVIGESKLAYLDSANTSQKPRQMVAAVEDHYLHHNANVSRAMHTLGAEATEAFEQARAKVARFIGAQPNEIIFTKNSSEALNLAAYTLGSRLGPDDEVVVSVAEHHSNIVPWQMACERTGATLRWFDVTDEGYFDMDKARDEALINERTKVISVTAMSNVLGIGAPLKQIVAWAPQTAVVIADGAQLVPHQPVNVADLGVDLLTFTGHKMLGPTGIGVLWGKSEVLQSLPPFLGGGEMIEIVKMTGSTYAQPPHRFEAGTPPIAQAVGLGAAVDYLSQIGMDAIADHDHQIIAYALERLREVPGLRILGPTSGDRGSVIAFTLADIHPHDVMQVLDSHGVAVRGGHHCARPLHERLGIQASVRMSAYLYTTKSEIDALIDGLLDTLRFFGASTILGASTPGVPS
ncbi:MAG: cysteine desulfurase [Propionibacteriaceae bacterium]|nr:cysteine desulfurase [Propionibacteriaceae bacterium]